VRQWPCLTFNNSYGYRDSELQLPRDEDTTVSWLFGTRWALLTLWIRHLIKTPQWSLWQLLDQVSRLLVSGAEHLPRQLVRRMPALILNGHLASNRRQMHSEYFLVFRANFTSTSTPHALGRHTLVHVKINDETKYLYCVSRRVDRQWALAGVAWMAGGKLWGVHKGYIRVILWRFWPGFGPRFSGWASAALSVSHFNWKFFDLSTEMMLKGSNMLLRNMLIGDDERRMRWSVLLSVYWLSEEGAAEVNTVWHA